MRWTFRSSGALARTRTWNHRLGGSSYILFNYKGVPVLCQKPCDNIELIA